MKTKNFVTSNHDSPKRVFLIVMDSVGIGAMPDADLYGDANSNTLLATSKSKYFSLPNLQNLGLFNIEGIPLMPKAEFPKGCFARMKETSNGKDTIIGHWEIAGIESKTSFPTYKHGFPKEIIEKFQALTGRDVVCNLPYSGTDVIKDFGLHHEKTGDLIVYTSADSVFQIAAHESIIPLEQLYRYCKIARDILVEEHSVARVIARPFTGTFPNYYRTKNRRDFSLVPPQITLLDQLKESGFDVISVGKISDIFSGKGITHKLKTSSNKEGIEIAIAYMQLNAANNEIYLSEAIKLSNFNGLCFVNLVDFDMLYGHRNDVDGYAKALAEFDINLPRMTENLKENDILIITADHGCDPSTASTDHSREYTPLIIYGPKIKSGVNLSTRFSFADIGATILDYFKIPQKIQGSSFLSEVIEI
ncbi:MAG: phosphopentomutase [Oscillospiraceae bacterium]|jgi:phosphopentomutase|nr:phosphopentomutase [Oscillospiraceae bacterium]